MSEVTSANAGGSTAAMRIVRLTLIVVGTAAYLGLAVLGWGGFAAFFSHPALIALAVVLFAHGWRGVLRRRKSQPGRARGSWQPLGHRSLCADRAAGRLSAGLHGPARSSGPSTAIPFAGLASFSLLPVVRCGSGRSLCSATDSAGWSPSSPGIRWSPAVSIGVIRHPSYLGLLVNFAGLGPGLSFGSRRAAHGAHHTAAPRAHPCGREAAAQSQFGDEYGAYRARTSRLIPGLY